MKRITTLFVATAISVVALSACTGYSNVAAQETAISASAASGPAVKSGTFSGLSDHITVGGASIIGTTGNYALVFANDFSLDGAPDPIVGFGSNGKYNAATKLGALTKKDGAQTYALPASFNPKQHNEVYVWCEKFDVALGVASLNAAKSAAKPAEKYGS